MRFAEGAPIPAITGTGAGLPNRVVDNAEIALLLDRPPKVINKVIGETVGVKTRRWVIPGEQASSNLASIAAMEAMDMAGIMPSNVKTLIVGTSSPDHISVAVAAMMQEQLGLRDNIRSYDVGGNACVGFIQSLKASFDNLTSPLGDEGPQVVAGVEVLSKMIPNDPTKGIFGDGAGAVVTEMVIPDTGAPTNMGFAFGADGKYSQDLLIPAGGSKYFTTEETERTGMHLLHMDGKIIFDQAVPRMAQMAREALRKSGMPIEEVAYFIPHQANLAIIRAVADELNFPMEKVIVTIDHTGNTSAGTIPIAMNESVRDGRIKRNDMVMFAAFGAGLEFAAGLIPMVGLPKHPR